jgi:hypothetical protein
MNRLAIVAFVASLTLACGGSESSAPLHELARVRSGSLDVVLLSSKSSLSPGKDAATIEFRAADDGRLVDVGTVKASATMPMGGMAPMVGGVGVQRTDVAGRYRAASDLNMAGEWKLTVEWNGPAGAGSASFSQAVH